MRRSVTMSMALGLIALPVAALGQVPVTDGLRLYLRADAGVTNTGNPAVDGGLVTDWTDGSGNGNDASAVGPTHQPTFVANGINGLPVVRFSVVDVNDAAGDVLSVPHDASLNPAQITAFIVARRNAPPGGGGQSDWQTMFIKSSGWSWTDGYGMTVTGSGSNQFSFWVNGYTSNTSGMDADLDTQPNLLVGSYDLDAVRLSLNGTPMSPDPFNGAINHVTDPLYIGASPGPSGFAVPDGFFNGDIAELLFYGRLLTPGEMATVQNYLATKYAIGQDAPLPVELRSFTGAATARGVGLSWATASERDNAGFTVLRNGVEIASYRTSPELRGHGTTGTARQYGFVDSRVVAGQTYTYTLRSTDRSGAVSSYPASSTVTVTEAVEVIAAPDAFALSPASPNPFNPTTQLTLSLSEPSTVTVMLYNTLGQPVRTILSGQRLEAGTPRITVDADGLATGVYVVRVQAVGQSGRPYAASQRVLLAK